jgi:hypothetical protein
LRRLNYATERIPKATARRRSVRIGGMKHKLAAIAST